MSVMSNIHQEAVEAVDEQIVIAMQVADEKGISKEEFLEIVRTALEEYGTLD